MMKELCVTTEEQKLEKVLHDKLNTDAQVMIAYRTAQEQTIQRRLAAIQENRRAFHKACDDYIARKLE